MAFEKKKLKSHLDTPEAIGPQLSGNLEEKLALVPGEGCLGASDLLPTDGVGLHKTIQVYCINITMYT